jgi:hypothetical protein
LFCFKQVLLYPSLIGIVESRRGQARTE